VRLLSALNRVFEASEAENRAAIVRIVQEHAPLPRVLDLGCYDGRFTRQLAEAARAELVAGVELLSEHAALACRRGVRVVLGDLNAPLPFAAGSFDLVHANQVIEHLQGTDRFLREAARVARPGGLIVVSTNNLASWHNVASLALGFQPHPSHVSDEVHVGNPLNGRDGVAHADAGQTHLRIFTGRALTELARYHGLEVVAMGASGYYPLPPRLARPLARLDRRHAAFLIGVFRACPAECG
jgi:SAM-dependent methyltransferase